MSYQFVHHLLDRYLSIFKQNNPNVKPFVSIKIFPFDDSKVLTKENKEKMLSNVVDNKIKKKRTIVSKSVSSNVVNNNKMYGLSNKHLPGKEIDRTIIETEEPFDEEVNCFAELTYEPMIDTITVIKKETERLKIDEYLLYPPLSRIFEEIEPKTVYSKGDIVSFWDVNYDQIYDKLTNETSIRLMGEPKAETTEIGCQTDEISKEYIIDYNDYHDEIKRENEEKQFGDGLVIKEGHKRIFIRDNCLYKYKYELKPLYKFIDKIPLCIELLLMNQTISLMNNSFHSKEVIMLIEELISIINKLLKNNYSIIR